MDYLKRQETLLRRLKHWLAAPFILVMIFPIVLTDIFLEIYHRIAFPLYGLKCVNRSSYIKIDRQKLSYLNWFQKLSCAYCGYANGAINYAQEIAGITESYWCGIMHEPKKGFHVQKHHKNFLPYGDEKAFKNKYYK